jgi:hypothetical protein
VNEALKTIEYRGGLVRFRIPASWIEEYEMDGGGTFYQDTPDAGILRLNVLTFRSNGPEPMDGQAARDLLKSYEKPNYERIIAHANGNSSIAYWKYAQENGESLALRYWHVASPVPPHHLRLAVFSYTLLKSQAAERRFVAEVRMLDSEIRSCEFAPELGVTSFD